MGIQVVLILLVGGVLTSQNEPVPTRDLASLIDEYRSGDAAQAVRQFAGWPRDRLLREAVGAFDRSDPRRAAAIAMLHLEAGLITDSFGNPDITFALLTTPDRTGEPHYRLSYPLIASLDSFAREKKDTELQAFCRNWWIATVSAIMPVS